MWFIDLNLGNIFASDHQAESHERFSCFLHPPSKQTSNLNMISDEEPQFIGRAWAWHFEKYPGSIQAQASPIGTSLEIRSFFGVKINAVSRLRINFFRRVKAWTQPEPNIQSPGLPWPRLIFLGLNPSLNMTNRVWQEKKVYFWLGIATLSYFTFLMWMNVGGLSHGNFLKWIKRRKPPQ